MRKSNEEITREDDKNERFVLRKAFWDSFTNNLKEIMKQINNIEMNLEEEVVELTTTIVAAAEDSISRENKTLKTSNKLVES